MLQSHFRIGSAPEDALNEEAMPEETTDPESKDADEDVPLKEVRYLKKSEISSRLSFLGKTANGDGYTYLKATLTDMKLTRIDAITCFKHLQFVDVSKNRLRLIELQAVTKLPHLILLQADENQLQSAALNKMEYLQVIIMNNNELTNVHDVFQPELSTLEVGFNKIQKIHFDNRMPSIRCLDFRNNQIVEIGGLDFPKLDSLYLANNNIISLAGLEKLVNLRILHVRNNPLRLLDGFHKDLTKLIYVNLRNCKIPTLRQVKKLRVLKNIETLIMKGCPYMGGTGEEDAAAGEEEDNPETRLEMLATLPSLKRINKATVTPEERTEAQALMLQWIEDGEKDEEEIEDEMLMHEELQ